MKYFFCDIDGTLTDDSWRKQFLPKHESSTAADYDKYNDLFAQDITIAATRIAAQRAIEDPETQLVFLTARPAKYVTETKADLIKRMGSSDFELHMRPDGDSMRSPELKLDMLREIEEGDMERLEHFVLIDDRRDVREAVQRKYSKATVGAPDLSSVVADPTPVRAQTPDDILSEMAKTFRERNKIYGDNYKRVGAVMAAMFPDGGVQLETPEDYNKWHLFELMVVKMTRFANSGLTHQDSIHDLAVYAAMVEAQL